MTDEQAPEPDDAGLRRRWAKKAPAVGLVPAEAIDGKVRTDVERAIDGWIRDEISRKRGDD